MQAREIVGSGRTDGGVEAAFAFACTQDIPQAEAVCEQAREAVGVGQAGQIFPGQLRQDGPEQVAQVLSLTPMHHPRQSPIDGSRSATKL